MIQFSTTLSMLPIPNSKRNKTKITLSQFCSINKTKFRMRPQPCSVFNVQPHTHILLRNSQSTIMNTKTEKEKEGKTENPIWICVRKFVPKNSLLLNFCDLDMMPARSPRLTIDFTFCFSNANRHFVLISMSVVCVLF